jgi:hypothetical protein
MPEELSLSGPCCSGLVSAMGGRLHTCQTKAACDSCQHQCPTRFIELPNESRAVVRPFCRIRREPAIWKRGADSSPFRVSTLQFVPEIQQLL